MKGGGLLPAHGDGEKIKVSIRERCDDGIMGLLNFEKWKGIQTYLKKAPNLLNLESRCDVFLFDDELKRVMRCFFSHGDFSHYV